MARSTMFGYSLASVVRTRRRSAVVVLALSLAVAIVAAPAVALDSEVHTLVNRVLASIPYDYVATGLSADFDNASAAAAAVDGVLGAEPVVTVAPAVTFAASGAGPVPIVIDFVRPSFARFSDRFGLAGSFQLAAGEVALTDRLAGRLGVALGSRVVLSNTITSCTSPGVCTTQNLTANETVTSVLATPLITSGSPDLAAALTGSSGKDPLFLSLADFETVRLGLGLPVAATPSMNIFVWADRSRIVNPYDPQGTQDAVLHLLRDIISAVTSGGFRVSEGQDPATGALLSDVVRLVNDSMGFERALLVLLSIPAALLAFLFARVGFETGLAKRRREIGILRSRGSTSRLVMSGLLVEALLLGSIAALVGLAISLAVSRVFLGFTNAYFPRGAAVPLSDVAVSPFSVLLAAAAAAVFAFVVAYSPVRRSSQTRIVHALRVTSTIETAVDYQEARTTLFTFVGIGGILFVIGLAGFLGRGGLLSFVLGAVLTVVLLLAPILLILGIARYITLGTNRPYRALARLVRPWLGSLDFLVVEGVRRSPRRSSNLAVIVAFALAFALFVVSLAGIVEGHDARTARTIVGGDISLTGANLGPGDVANLVQTPGVATAATVYFIPSNYGTLAAIRSPDYLATVGGVDAYYFKEGAPSALGTLVSDGGALASGTAARDFGLHLGDPLVLNIIVGGVRGVHMYTVRVTVTAVVTALPGLQQSGGPVDSTPLVVVDLQTLQSWGVSGFPSAPPGERVLVRIDPAADADAIAKGLEVRWSTTATVYRDVLSSMRTDPFQAALLGQLYTDAGLAVIVAVLAVSVMAYASGVDREGEFATFVARGLTRRQLAALLFGEALAVGLIGVLPVVPMVIIFLWAFTSVSSTVLPTSLPFEFMIPLAAWLLLLAAMGALVMGALFAGLRLRWMNVPRVLKLRGV